MHSSRSHSAVIHVYDGAGNVIETHQQKGESQTPFVASGVYSLKPRARRRCWHQLWVKVAVSVMGPPIVIEAGLFVPE